MYMYINICIYICLLTFSLPYKGGKKDLVKSSKVFLQREYRVKNSVSRRLSIVWKEVVLYILNGDECLLELIRSTYLGS